MNTPANIADSIFYRGRITTLTALHPSAEALAIKDGRILAIGREAEVMRHAGVHTQMIHLLGQSVLPGLHDSHLHLIRGGLNYNMELRWDGVTSLAVALTMLRQQVQKTPPPQWVRVVGGFTEHQFAEKRLPTIDEINAIAPETPVFILHLYDRALLNRAALIACGYDKNTPSPAGGEIVRDKAGNPTGLLVARPNALILYATLAKGPKLSRDDQINSTRLFMRELNRLGVTSAIDAGGGFQNYPDDYGVIEQLAREQALTVRIAYNLFTQHPKAELEDFHGWIQMVSPLAGDSMYRHNGAGEMLVFSAADFEDFQEPRPDLAENMEKELEAVVRLLVEKRWPFRIHATYNESITRMLEVYERVHRDIPFDGLHWFFDHAETISERNIERVKALGGGVAIQNRMSFQGEYFVKRYGLSAAQYSPPIRKMLLAGIPVGGGTDATRVSSYNPWLSLHWLVSGKTLGGLTLYPADNRLDRETALRLWTVGSAWFANTPDHLGTLAVGELADFIVPSADYFSVAEEDIAHLTSHLTVVGGRIVHADGGFSALSPPAPKASPNWSPIADYGGFQHSQHSHSHSHSHWACWDASPRHFWNSCGCWI